jgi:hypothetical protein
MMFDDDIEPLSLFDSEREDEFTKIQRQHIGTLGPPDSETTAARPPRVNRAEDSGLFVSQNRGPEPLLRDAETGEYKRDRFAVGAFLRGDDE